MYRFLVCLCLMVGPLLPSDLSSLSNQETGKGLKEALVQRVGQAVGELSVTDGFLGIRR